jgi:hypothetical protein
VSHEQQVACNFVFLVVTGKAASPMRSRIDAITEAEHSLESLSTSIHSFTSKGNMAQSEKHKFLGNMAFNQELNHQRQ